MASNVHRLTLSEITVSRSCMFPYSFTIPGAVQRQTEDSRAWQPVLTCSHTDVSDNDSRHDLKVNIINLDYPSPSRSAIYTMNDVG